MKNALKNLFDLCLIGLGVILFYIFSKYAFEASWPIVFVATIIGGLFGAFVIKFTKFEERLFFGLAGGFVVLVVQLGIRFF